MKINTNTIKEVTTLPEGAKLLASVPGKSDLYKVDKSKVGGETTPVEEEVYKEVVLSSADITNLGSAYPILPSIDTSTYYDISKIILEYAHGDVSFVPASSDFFYINGCMKFYVEDGLIRTNTLDTVSIITPSTYVVSGTKSVNARILTGTGLNIEMASRANIATPGDGTMKIKVWYTIRTFG